MAGLEEHSSFSFNSYQTAMAILPPNHSCKDINTLRAAYDKAYDTWPAHINLIYPFVHPDLLPAALRIVEGWCRQSPPHNNTITLSEAGCFSNKHKQTIYLGPSDDTNLQKLRQSLLAAFSKPESNSYNPHLTVGQTGPTNHELRDSLMLKVRLLPKTDWQYSDVVILVRHEDKIMRVWKTVPIASLSKETSRNLANVSLSNPIATEPQLSEEEEEEEEEEVAVQGNEELETRAIDRRVRQGKSFRFDSSANRWKPIDANRSTRVPDPLTGDFHVASYNVLIDSIHPPPTERFNILLRAILSNPARADVLLLQEVSDDFLSYILEDDDLRKQYPYTTHAPPNQADAAPLFSLRNIIILSRRSFDWEYVPFERRHKGAVLVRSHHVGTFHEGKFCPLVIAGIHLTCGLTDGSVAAKASQIRTLLRHLALKYPNYPWIVAGDFNVNTSKRMINDAVKTRSISTETVKTLRDLEDQISEAGLIDSWVAAKVEDGLEIEDCPEGEEGATFDPIRNPLAARIVGYGAKYRPQRYDRILVNGRSTLHIRSFNMFGLPETHASSSGSTCGSDHWGVRASMQVHGIETSEVKGKTAQLSLPDLDRTASAADNEALRSYVTQHPTFPNTEETSRRKNIFQLVSSSLAHISSALNKVTLVIVPVGSYGLGVWNTISDIDCLCIGSVSSKTFFTLAVQHLRRASDDGIRILRKVEAHSGTMLEIEAQGVRLDIQYCAAARIAESWPTPLALPVNDPLFSISQQALSKLKAIRDITTLQETMPDLPAYQLAHRFLVLWATKRGIYAARFGYLGGLHIALMLNRAIKLLYALYPPDGPLSAAHYLRCFFHYYANVDWSKEIVEDPVFSHSRGRRPYLRRIAEPMVILGFHTPNSNVARQATTPALHTVTEEIQRADKIIASQLKNAHVIDWSELISGNGDDGVTRFVTTYKSYIQINVRFWGANKGGQLLGWIESRFPSLLADLNRRMPEVQARIWPERLTRDLNQTFSSDTNDESTTVDFQGCYLIGLTKNNSTNTSDQTPDDRRIAQNKLQSVLDNFVESIRENGTYFSAATAWTDVDHIKQSDLGSLHHDTRVWGADVFDADLSDFENDEDEQNKGTLGAPPPPTSLDNYTSTTPSIPGKKLRPASDVLHRLRWDPNLQAADFVVGYTDRFLGTREIALERWKTEQTDEEFIPQHRIVYFRRKTDGIRVWDRERRVDLLFG